MMFLGRCKSDIIIIYQRLGGQDKLRFLNASLDTSSHKNYPVDMNSYLLIEYRLGTVKE